MTGQQILDLLVQRLGDRTDLRASILLEMIMVQQTVLEGGPLLPWFLLQGEGSLTITGGDRAVPVPTDFLREHDEGLMLIQDTSGNWQEVIKDEYDILVQKHTLGATSALPLEYALLGLNFQLFPIPTDVRPLKLSQYYKKAAVPADDTTEPLWLKYAPDLLIAETGMVMASQYLENPEKTTTFVAMAQIARKRLSDTNIAREEANRSRSMGDD